VNAINWQPKALRQLRKIDAHAGRQIRAAVNTELLDLSKARNVKPLLTTSTGIAFASATIGSCSTSTVRFGS
jgi:mRNA-degrading endonuclease RelE of RelBE toxin-antitoxin system